MAPAATDIYTLSLHDALPICRWPTLSGPTSTTVSRTEPPSASTRSEEHTSELQSPYDLVCRLLLEKKKTAVNTHTHALQLRALLSPRLRAAFVPVPIAPATRD